MDIFTFREKNQSYIQPVISLYNAQNMIHLEFNFSLLIPDNIFTEAVASIASMVVTAVRSRFESL